MKVIHKKSGIVLAAKAKEANWLQKIIGLMGKKHFGPYDGLFISWHNSVHNCFVRFPIDVVFLSKSNTIVKILRHFRPWHFSAFYFKARHLIEFPAGTITDKIHVGDELELLP